MALGASRAEIVRQLLVESLVLVALGGACGVALAAGLMRVVVAMMPPFMLPAETVIELNLPVLLFTVAACGLSGVVSGLAPAWQAARADLNQTLKEAGRGVHGGRHGLRRALVVLEFALALTLLTGGGLALYSFTTLARTELGFRTERLLTFALPIPQDRLRGDDAITQFYDALVERVRALPGVVSAAVSTGLPLQGFFGSPFAVADRPVADRKQRPNGRVNLVTAEDPSTMGIAITRGRGITAQDRAGTQPVALVNETLVRQFFGDADPLTQRIVMERRRPGVPALGADVTYQVVGVTRDVRSGGPKQDIRPEIHVPFAQSPWPRARMVVRTAGEPGAIQQSIAGIVQGLDPDLPIGNVRTMEQVVAQAMVGDRFNTLLFGSFAAAAADPRRDGDLRRDVLRGGPADARDRPAHGARRGPDAGAPADPARGDADGARRHGAGLRRRLVGRPRDARPGVRRQRAGAGRVRGGHAHAPGRGARRVSRARDPGGVGRSDGRAAPGLSSGLSALVANHVEALIDGRRLEVGGDASNSPSVVHGVPAGSPALRSRS